MCNQIYPAQQARLIGYVASRLVCSKVSSSSLRRAAKSDSESILVALVESADREALSLSLFLSVC